MEKVQYEAKQNNGILMNANESYRNVSKEVLQQIKDALDSIAFNRYPIDDACDLCYAYANYIGVEQSQLIAGNGSDELLGLLVSLCIKEGKKLYTLNPDFTMYDYYTSMANGEMVKFKLEPEDVFDVDEFIEQGRREDIDMIMFSNPNNPTGRILCVEELIKIVESFPGKLVVIDEAYADFSTTTMLPYIERYPNLAILRTMSKAFGMAGIRCGFLIAGNALMNKIRPYKVPYNVSVLTQVVGTIALSHPEDTAAFLKEVTKNRDEFYKAYQKAQLEDVILYPSQANFIYGSSTKKQAFLNALEKRDIAIRDYANTDRFRITIGTKEQNQMLLDALMEVFKKEVEQ